MNEEQQELQRGLKNRHVQLISIGGAIGTGLFLGSGKSIQLAGQSILLCLSDHRMHLFFHYACIRRTFIIKYK